MALRTINYTVNANGIDPPTLQSGGLQGEHNATELVFNLAEKFVDALIANADGAELMYRIEGHTGAGTKNSTEAIAFGVDEEVYNPITYKLENWLTKDGGNIRVYLIISILKEDQTLMDIYSFPAVIKLTAVPDVPFNDGENYESMTLLSESARVAAKTAKESAEQSLYNAERTESAKFSLENGAEFVFLGGDAKSALKMDLVIDDKINDNSQNPVQNSAILNYINSEIEKAKKDALLLSHPIGSYYFSDFDTDPALLFGGEWERVKDRFILAAGDIYNANTVGGSDEHSHSLNSGYALVSATGGLGDGINLKRIEVEEYDSIFYDAEFSDNEEQKTTYATALGGSSDTCSNMPPFITAYCFKRIA